MPIDDIGFLQEHSVKDTIQFFIDSNMRDHEFYPNPNEYVYEFQDPIRFVYGLDVLDASIPNTMFNIDSHTNTIAFVMLEQLTDVPDEASTRVPISSKSEWSSDSLRIETTNEYADGAVEVIVTSSDNTDVILLKMVTSPDGSVIKTTYEFSGDGQLTTTVVLKFDSAGSITEKQTDVLDASTGVTAHTIDVFVPGAATPDAVASLVSLASLVSSSTTWYDVVMPPHASSEILPRLLEEQQNDAFFEQLFNFKLHNEFRAYIVDADTWLANPGAMGYYATTLQSFREECPTLGELKEQCSEMIILTSRYGRVAANQLLANYTMYDAANNNGDVTSPVIWLSSPGTRSNNYATLWYSIPRDSVPATKYLALLQDSLVQSGMSEVVTYVRFDWQLREFQVTICQTIFLPPSMYIGSLHPVLGMRHMCLHGLKLVLENGQYDINTLQNELKQQLMSYGFRVVSTDRKGGEDLTKQGRARFTNINPFVFQMDVSSIYESLGFEAYAVREHATYNYVEFNRCKRLFASYIDFMNGYHYVIPPGMFNLLGTRYVRLRCKEIEDHLSSIAKYNPCSVGIGTFRLADIRDLSNVRFDFTTLIPKPFHPIGMLSKLTLKFETPRGNTYDFKGFNHNMLIAVKYLSPDMPRTFKGSSLNPNYDPNFMRYMLTRDQFVLEDRARDEQLLSGWAGRAQREDPKHHGQPWRTMANANPRAETGQRCGPLLGRHAGHSGACCDTNSTYEPYRNEHSEDDDDGDDDDDDDDDSTGDSSSYASNDHNGEW